MFGVVKHCEWWCYAVGKTKGERGSCLAPCIIPALLLSSSKTSVTVNQSMPCQSQKTDLKQSPVLWMIKYEIVIAVIYCCFCIIILQIVVHSTVYCITYYCVSGCFMEWSLHVVTDIHRAVKFLSEALETSSVKTVFCSSYTALLQHWMSPVYEIWVLEKLRNISWNKDCCNCDRRFTLHIIWFCLYYKWKKNIDWVCFRMQCWGEYLDLKCRK